MANKPLVIEISSRCTTSNNKASLVIGERDNVSWKAAPGTGPFFVLVPGGAFEQPGGGKIDKSFILTIEDGNPKPAQGLKAVESKPMKGYILDEAFMACTNTTTVVDKDGITIVVEPPEIIIGS